MDNLNNNKTKYFPREPWELKKAEESGSPSETGTSFADIRNILEKAKDSPQAKILITLLAVFAALGAAAKDVFADNFVEKLVVSDQDGNITPVLNKNGEVNIGSSIFVSEDLWYGVRGVFDKDNYICTDEDSDKLSIRDNKTLEETDYVTAKARGYLTVDLETGTKAFVQRDKDINIHQIHLLFKDGTEQTLTPNPYEPKSSSYQPNINALEFSDSKLYAATSTDQQKKYWIQVFKQDVAGDGQCKEDIESKSALPAEFYFLASHNGKLVVNSGTKLLIYNHTSSLQLEKTIELTSSVNISALAGRPDSNTVWGWSGDKNGASGIGYIDLDTYEIKTVRTFEELEDFLGDNEYGFINKIAFSNDGKRCYLATQYAFEKSQHYFVTIYLNPDGTVSKMEKSILTEGSPAPVPIDLAMDVDPDGDKITNGIPDNCPDIANNAQIDKDKNGIGDACENPEEYKASQGYEAYQEPPGTGHNVYTNGDVDVIDMGDNVVIAPVEGKETEVGIINNGNEQTKNIYVKIPPNTDYVWTSFEGFGDDEKTEGIDFPEGKTVEGETEENGVLVGISGTDIKVSFKPKTIQPEQTETQADEITPVEEVFEGVDEVSIPDEAKDEEISTADEIIPDTAEEVTPDTQDAYEAKETTSEIIPETDVIQPPDQFDAYDPGKDTGSDTIQPDTEKPKDGGGGCDMNNSANGKEALGLGAALTALMLALKKKFAKALKG